ncbi:MAG TPA: Gfo/Idh/MocA family oxidoreductase [Caldilineaceae bacterium]|nr:Gfo/Idh/MocA family oxidoreductase [Caldilineaceae bacterium]
MNPLRLAIIGAGIFARDAHVPSLCNLRDRFTIAAIYSRTAASAQALADVITTAQGDATDGSPAEPIALYTDLAALLDSPTIDAVDVVLPIPVMAPILEQVLASGKDLISEKPLAADVATSRRLLAAYRDQGQERGQVWMVGENWRYETAYVRAAELVRNGAIGRPLTCHMALYLPMVEGSKYFGTTWRRSADFFGGTLMDGGVHHAALLRMVVGEIAEVSAYTTHTSRHFTAADTLSATLHFANGAVGTYLVTYGWGAPWGGEFHVVGDQGALRVQRGLIEVTKQGQTEHIPTAKFDGVELEFAAFADAIQQVAPHRNTPEEGLRDVAVVEAMVRSAETRQSVAPTE